MNPITLTITGNPTTYQIDWEPNLDIQSALEKIYTIYHPQDPLYDFVVQYYGYGTDEYLGYMIIKMDDKFQNPTTGEYWFVSVNNNDLKIGIDSYILSPGAALSLEYKKYDQQLHKNTHVAILHTYHTAK